MAMLTLARAVRQSRLSKTVILNAIKSGRLPAAKNARGLWQIDAIALRGFIKAPEDRRKSDPGEVDKAQFLALEAENRALRKQVGLLKRQVGDLKADRDRWAKQAEQAGSLARSNQRVMRRANKNLAELRRDALMEAKEAAEAAAREAERLGVPAAPPQPSRISSAEWTHRFGLRSLRSA